MKSILAAALSLAVATPVLAAECAFEGAVYENAASGWQVRIVPLPPERAANQLAAFTLSARGIDGRLEGGVYVPNGFGQPMADIGLNCPAIGDESETDAPPSDGADEVGCGVWSGSLYQLANGSMGVLDYDVDSFAVMAAPDQLLLPDFAAAIWYSEFREVAFADDRSVGDVFTRIACGK